MENIVYCGDKLKFFTNGEETIKLKHGDIIPCGFHEGRTFKANPWNKGKTASSDYRVAENVRKMLETRIENGSYENPWNKGLTKNNNESLKIVSEKVSESRKSKPSWNKGLPMSDETKNKLSESHKGIIPWNKGLSKETSDSVKSMSEKLIGHTCFVSDWDAAKRKEYETKKKNNSFNSSKMEQDLISEMVKIYGENDVIHPYRDERYPFNCDIYIKSQDLFIEVHGTVEHYGRPFDKNNPLDVQEANTILEKAKNRGAKSRYWNIYRWWTEIDPNKLETFRKNNLNFKIIYPNLIIEE